MTGEEGHRPQSFEASERRFGFIVVFVSGTEQLRFSLPLGEDVPRGEDVATEKDVAVLDEQHARTGGMTGREDHTRLTWHREDVPVGERFDIGDRIDGSDAVAEHFDRIGEELWPP